MCIRDRALRVSLPLAPVPMSSTPPFCTQSHTAWICWPESLPVSKSDIRSTSSWSSPSSLEGRVAAVISMDLVRRVL